MTIHQESSARLHGRWLVIARAVWIALALLTVFTLLLASYIDHAYLSTLGGWTPDTYSAALAQLGFSANNLDNYHLLSATLLRLVYIGISAVIFWKKADDRMAFLLSISLLTFSVTTVSLGSTAKSYSLLAGPIELLQVVGQTGLMLCFFVFPDGRFVPHWARWPTAVTLTLMGLSRYSVWLQEMAATNPVAWVFILWLFAAIPLQIYRYRRVSTPTQRQQTKWALFGFAGFLLLASGTWAVSYAVLPSLAPSIQDQSPAGLVFLLVRDGIQYIGYLALPVCLAIAVLRYRLWDIDIIIRKTLVYAVLSGLLALVYFGMVVLLQSLFDSVSGQESPILIVISTLLIAALFAPLRRRIQDVIDRRFYRKKYDAQQVLAQFAITARDETDMDALTAELVRVVQETMQPTQVNIWLKPTADYSRNDFRNV